MKKNHVRTDLKRLKTKRKKRKIQSGFTHEHIL